ncbi:zinc-binding dehydrogenase [Pantoea sp. 1.19]|uniref:zinc-binding dehydrogenase n=1 Tax=Pantoea sp. 1.19 TaxID=1925589 RepID=UPI0009489D5E|nr:zinc-binding dehydrogenase [Pantoea sp. 1.19]
MKAQLLQQTGSDYQLTLAEVDAPEPGPGEVRIRVRGSSINPVDYKFAQQGKDLPLPHILGIDAAGEIDAVGEGVTAFQPGDRVMALTNLYRWGGFAEQVVVDARVVSRLPDGLDFARAGVLPCAALTAWQAVHLKLNLQPGQTVLITAAGGGVGSFAVQMARRAGARVIASASRQAQWLRDLGADAVVNRREGDLVAQVLSATDGRGVDAIIDLVSADSATALLPLLRHNGAIACVVGRPSSDAMPAWGKALSVHDVALGFAWAYGDGDNLRDIARAGESVAQWVADGEIVVTFADHLSLAAVPQALRAAEEGKTYGKVAIAF